MSPSTHSDRIRRRPVSRATCLAVLAASVVVGGSHVGFAGPAAPEVVDSLGRYCQASWRNSGIPPEDWEECTQQLWSELLDTVPANRIDHAIGSVETEERRELIRSIWRVAKRYQRGQQRRDRHSAGHAQLDQANSDRTPSDPAVAVEQAEAVEVALDRLPPFQRDILVAWSQGATVQEIATQFDLPPARVSDVKYKAIQRLRRDLDAA